MALWLKKLGVHAGSYLYLISLTAHIQLEWAIKNHNDYKDIWLRLLFALLAGAVLAFVFNLVLSHFLQIKSKNSQTIFSCLLISMYPGVFFIPGAFKSLYLVIALATPGLLLAFFAINRWKIPRLWPLIRKSLSVGAILLGSLLLAFAACEIYLRIISTLGPESNYNPQYQSHLDYKLFNFNGKNVRFITVEQPRYPGRAHIMLLGDSITWGVGVLDWKDIYVNQLSSFLHKKYEISVFARVGREINDHLDVIRKYGKKYHPDIIIYQWYLNDMELDKKGRPKPRLIGVEKLPGHDWLMDHSYLWFYLVKEMQMYKAGRTYVEYIKQDFTPGSRNWMLFQIYYRMWLSEATSLAKRVIVFLYPGLPYGGEKGKEYPLKELDQRIVQESKLDYLIYPASAAWKNVGQDVKDHETRFGLARKAWHDKTHRGDMLLGPWVNLKPNKYYAIFHLKADALTSKPVAVLEVTEQSGKKILARREVSGLDFVRPNGWQDFQLDFSSNGADLKKVEFRLVYLGGADLSVDYVKVYWPLPKTVEVIDGVRFLKDLHTWSNPYDAHPNKKTHALIADILLKQIESKSPSL